MPADPKTVARKIFEGVWNKGNLAMADELIAANYVDNDPSLPFAVRSRDDFKKIVAFYRTPFPDVAFTIDDQVAEGDKVVTRWTARGTHKAEFMGIAATQKRLTVTGVSMTRVVNGKAQEAWTNWDALGMLQQLGAVPKMQPA